MCRSRWLPTTMFNRLLGPFRARLVVQRVALHACRLAAAMLSVVRCTWPEQDSACLQVLPPWRRNALLHTHPVL